MYLLQLIITPHRKFDPADAHRRFDRADGEGNANALQLLQAFPGLETLEDIGAELKRLCGSIIARREDRRGRVGAELIETV